MDEAYDDKIHPRAPSVSALYPKSASACDRSRLEVEDIKEQVRHLTYILVKVLERRDYTCSWKCPIYRHW